MRWFLVRMMVDGSGWWIWDQGQCWWIRWRMEGTMRVMEQGWLLDTFQSSFDFISTLFHRHLCPFGFMSGSHLYCSLGVYWSLSGMLLIVLTYLALCQTFYIHSDSIASCVSCILLMVWHVLLCVRYLGPCSFVSCFTCLSLICFDMISFVSDIYVHAVLCHVSYVDCSFVFDMNSIVSDIDVHAFLGHVSHIYCSFCWN